MTHKSIANPELFKIFDENSQETHYGGNQEWYPKKRQRFSGCGPTVASNIFFYLSHSQTAPEFRKNPVRKEDWVVLMEKMWNVVTPSLRGVHKTKMFYEPFLEYTKAMGFNANYSVCDVPKEQLQRPTLSQILDFLSEALSQNAPIAFLNLCNGEEKNLERWHWVTIISLEYFDGQPNAYVEILDEGLIKKIDLALWCKTTTLGGGFVYFTLNRDSKVNP